MQDTQPVSTIFVIYGAAGDLAQRKLIPALYNLLIDGWLPEAFHVFGAGRTEMDADWPVQPNRVFYLAPSRAQLDSADVSTVQRGHGRMPCGAGAKAMICEINQKPQQRR